MLKLSTLLITLLTTFANGDDVPFYLQEVEGKKDIGAINENFRSTSDKIKKIDLTSGGTVAGNLTLSGSGNGIVFPDGTVQVSSPAASSSVSIISISTRSYSGDQSITATASPGNFVTSSTLTITGLSANSKVMICASIPTVAGVLRRVAIDFSIDTDSQKLGGGTFGACVSDSDNEDVLSCCTTTNPLSSGNHTFWMYAWTMNGNTYTISKGNPPMSISILSLP